MMMILIVDGVVMDIIEMMVDKQADLRLHMEDDEVTKHTHTQTHTNTHTHTIIFSSIKKCSLKI